MRPLLANAFPRISQILLPLKIRSHQRFLITNATCGRGFRGTASPAEAQTFSTSITSMHFLDGGSWGIIPQDLRWVPPTLRWIAPWPVSNCVGSVNCLGGFDSATDCWDAFSLEAVSLLRSRDSGWGFGSALDVCASLLAANLAERFTCGSSVSPTLFGNSRVDTRVLRKSGCIGDTTFDLFGWGCMSWGISSVTTSMLHGLWLDGQFCSLLLSLEMALSSSSSELSTILRRADSLPPPMASKELPPCSDRVPFSFALVGC